MTVYIAVCQYIWCDKKHNPKDFGLSRKEASQVPNPFADVKDNNTPKGWITIPGEMVDKSSFQLMEQYSKEFEKLKK